MLQLSLDHAKSILCLGAHSDDIEIGCGGTLLSLFAANPSIDVEWIVLGANGARSHEAQASAEQFLAGVPSRNVVVRGFRDSYFPYEGAAIKEFVESVRDRVVPDIIFTHRRDDLHQDHRVVAELTYCAFRDHLVLEYEIPKYDGDLAGMNVYVPLEQSIHDRKVDLLMESFPSQRTKPWFDAETFRAVMRLRGIECQSPSGFAEAFQSRKVALAASSKRD